MATTASAARLAAIFAVTMAMAPVAVSTAATNESKAILVLHTYGYDAQGRIPFDAAFVRTLREDTSVKVDVYIESLDPNRFGGERQSQRTREYLRQKYADKEIAVLVPVFDSAVSFLLDTPDPLFPTVPVAALVTRAPQAAAERVAFIWTGNFAGASTALALKLHPRATQIVVIDGGIEGADRDTVFQETRSQIEALRPRIPVSFLRNLPLDELLRRVQALPPETIIFLARQMIGRRGEPILHADALKEVAQVARAPIYVSTDQLMGLGAVGGIVIGVEAEARQLAALALGILRHGPRPGPPVESIPVPMFDWRQLHRWGIDEDLLPAHSEVQFRQLGLWDQYRWYAIGAISVCAVQSASIVGLLVHRRRRRRAEVALRSSESALRASAGQVQTLAGRLIAAQEVERSRIARELHDDLSQKLALLSIEIDQLAIEGTGEMIDRVRVASTRVGEISTGVHNLSHELHPARLEVLGLGTALQGLCREMSSAHNARIEFERLPIPAAIPKEAALCLFRVTQESLRNVVKHSGALAARVTLQHTNGMLELQIADSGCGFAAGADLNGLGLVSMRERVSLVGGEILVQSNAGMGTRINVKVPVPQRQA